MRSTVNQNHRRGDSWTDAEGRWHVATRDRDEAVLEIALVMQERGEATDHDEAVSYAEGYVHECLGRHDVYCENSDH